MLEIKNHTDLRVIKTQKAIRNAFAELLTEKDIQDITVSDIANRAIINRKTFYNYYKDIHQIVDEIENEVISGFQSTIDNFDIKNPTLIFSKLNAVINSDFILYQSLLKMTGNSNLIAKLKTSLKSMASDSISRQVAIDAENLSIMLDFTIAGMVSVYQSWFNSDQSKSLEELGDIVSGLSFCGITGIIDKGQTYADISGNV